MLVVTIFFILRVYKMANMLIFFLLEEDRQFGKFIRSEGWRSSGLNASSLTDDDRVESTSY